MVWVTKEISILFIKTNRNLLKFYTIAKLLICLIRFKEINNNPRKFKLNFIVCLGYKSLFSWQNIFRYTFVLFLLLILLISLALRSEYNREQNLEEKLGYKLFCAKQALICLSGFICFATTLWWKLTNFKFHRAWPNLRLI